MASVYTTDRLDNHYSLEVLQNPNSGDDIKEYFRRQDAKMSETSYYVTDQFMYMNMLGKGLRVEGVVDIMENLKTDTFLQHVNLAMNIGEEEAAKPSKMRALHAAIRGALRVNKTLTALDLSYNHLFDYTKHPTNEHVHDYMVELTDSLVKSKVVRLNISGNYLCGKGGREYTGILYLVRKFCARGGLKALWVRDNKLHSQGCASVSEGLGVHSKLEELDLRDNFLGLDPTGRFNSEGMQLMARQLSQSLCLHTLKLARNCLRDEDITFLGEAVSYMPRLEILDLSGNLFTGIAMIALKQAIISHSALTGKDEGLKKLDLSFNRIGEVEGMMHLCEALKCTLTLYSIGLRSCGIGIPDMKKLTETLKHNCTVMEIDLEENPVQPTLQGLCCAEVEALRVVYSLRKNHMAVDTGKLTMAVYKAAAQKLRFLEPGVLELLYLNPSFTVENSEMRVCLELFHPPSRKILIGGVLAKDENLAKNRLGHSGKHDAHLRQMRIIFHGVMGWWEVKRKEIAMKALLQKQRKAAAEASKKNEESAF